MSLWGFSLSVITAVLFIISPMLVKRGMNRAALTDVNPIRSVGYLGAMLVIAVIFERSAFAPPLGLSAWGLLCVNVILGNVVGDLFFFTAIKYIGLSLGVAISSTYPLVSAAVSVMFLGESLTWGIAFATGLTVTGVVMLRLGGGVTGDVSGKHVFWGYLFAAVAAVFWGISIPVTRWFMTEGGMTPIRLGVWRATMMFVVAWFVWAYRVAQKKESPSHIFTIGYEPWIAMTCAATVGLAVGGYTISMALSVAPASLVTPITSSNPILAAIMSYFLYKERLSAVQWAGITAVVLGAVIIKLSG